MTSAVPTSPRVNAIIGVANVKWTEGCSPVGLAGGSMTDVIREDMGEHTITKNERELEARTNDVLQPRPAADY